MEKIKQLHTTRKPERNFNQQFNDLSVCILCSHFQLNLIPSCSFFILNLLADCVKKDGTGQFNDPFKENEDVE